MYPQWYAFFYLTTRLGLRTGEVYAISRDRIRDIPPQLIVDRSVQRGNKERPAMLGPRKNNKVLTLALTEDVVDAIRWHVREGYAATSGHSIKAIQAQLGHTSARSTHQYAHLGQRAQLRIVEALRPASPPHVNVRSTNESR